VEAETVAARAQAVNTTTKALSAYDQSLKWTSFSAAVVSLIATPVLAADMATKVLPASAPIT
jgi:hypothetical protein